MRKSAGAVVGLIASGPLLLAVPVIGIAAVSASASCSADDPQAVDTAAVAAQVKAILNGGEAGTDPVPGLDDPGEQVPHAKVIQATGTRMGIPARGQVVALATALGESGLRNLSYGDRDSLGLFQQRPSQGWGTASEILDPAHASTRFYSALVKVPGWESLTVAQAAQAVQKSGYPGAYARWEPLAAALQKAIEPLVSKTGGASARPFPAGSDGTSTSQPSATDGCATGGDGTGFGSIPAGALLAGYEIPADAPRRVRVAIRWALGQLGTPYQWGGSCTASHGPDPMGRCDCSSLMQQAYKAAGVTLTRTTYTQVKEGEPVSGTAPRPGDLVFTRGTAEVPEHVGMSIGRGLIVHAPRTGDVVRIATLASWKSQILAVRRVL